MKGILLSIKPKYVSMILNKDKTIEIRKRFPSDYVGWVYIYVTKDENKKLYFSTFHGKYMVAKYVDHKHKVLNGKVVARFWCDKVEEIKYLGDFDWFYTDLLKKSCLNIVEFRNYLFIDTKKLGGYAIHITKLEIFNKPKEIREFRRYCDKHFSWWTNRCLDCKAYTPDTDIEDYCNKNKLALTSAPQSWCYVEI